MSTLYGFCLVEQCDTTIGPDRRCLADQSIVIAPSTGCAHQRLRNGAWSACPMERPCKPVPPKRWSSPPTPTESAQNQAARRFSGGTVAVPKLASAHKPAKAPGRRERAQTAGSGRSILPSSRWSKNFDRCQDDDCRTPHARHKGYGVCVTCWERNRCRAAGAKAYTPGVDLVLLPCPVCHKPFKAKSNGMGRVRRKTCSLACSNVTRKSGWRERQEIAS
jgi:hypothetical protein